MSYVVNNVRSLGNLDGLGWETKIINPFEAIDIGDADILIEFRDWLLGGERTQWRFHRSKLDGSLILERR